MEQSLSWANVQPSVLQGSILGPLLPLIYINLLSHDFYSTAKLFSDDTSMFSVLHDVDTSKRDSKLMVWKNLMFVLSNKKWVSIQMWVNKRRKLLPVTN